MTEENKMNSEKENLNDNKYEDDGVTYFNDSNEFANGVNGDDYSENANESKSKRKKFNKNLKSGKKIKKRWIVLGVIAILIVGSIIWDKIDKYDQIFAESYDWPQSEMAQMLPEPENKILSISEDEGESLDFEVVATSEDCKKYIDQCKEKGFMEKSEMSQSSGDYDFLAYNSEGYKLEISNDVSRREMDVYLYSPEYLAERESNQDAIDTSNSSETAETNSNDQSSSTSNDTSSDFKETIDSYEDFMDEYISFMETYNSSGSTLDMIDDYNDMLQQYNDFSQKIESIDENSLSEEDYNYYIEVTTRVTNKLLNAGI